MYWYSLRTQCISMIRKKTTVITFFIILALVMINFYVNMITNYNIGDVTQMKDTVKMLTLSDWTICGYYIMEFYPLLVVLPTACAYMNDKEIGIRNYMDSRIGKKIYWYSKVMAVFIVTVVVFTVPFILELLISGISFGFNHIGDGSGIDYISVIENENKYLFFKLFFKNKVIYAVVMILIFGIVSGILAVFNFSIVTLPFFKYKIFAFFPLYILIYILSFVQKLARLKHEINYKFILRMFSTSDINYAEVFVFLSILNIISFVLISKKIRQEDVENI